MNFVSLKVVDESQLEVHLLREWLEGADLQLMEEFVALAAEVSLPAAQHAHMRKIIHAEYYCRVHVKYKYIVYTVL